MPTEQQLFDVQSAFEGIVAIVMSQADRAIFDYRAECGRRGDGQWAEQLAQAMAEILTTAKR